MVFLRKESREFKFIPSLVAVVAAARINHRERFQQRVEISG